jgi:transcriptional regulator with XRE-family HTH domain
MAKTEPTPGARLRARRKELGLTQEQVAARTGGAYDQTQYSKLERDITEQPRGAAAIAIAKALDVAPGDIWKSSKAAMGAQTPVTSLREEWDDFQDRFLPVLEVLAEALEADDGAALRKMLGVPARRGRGRRRGA